MLLKYKSFVQAQLKETGAHLRQYLKSEIVRSNNKRNNSWYEICLWFEIAWHNVAESNGKHGNEGEVESVEEGEIFLKHTEREMILVARLTNFAKQCFDCIEIFKWEKKHILWLKCWPEEVCTRSDEGHKKGNRPSSSFQVVLESSFLLLLLLLRAPGHQEFKMCLMSCLSFYLSSSSKLLNLFFFKKSYSGFGFMILYFSISGITFLEYVCLCCCKKEGCTAFKYTCKKRDISSIALKYFSMLLQRKEICPPSPCNSSTREWQGRQV